MMAKKENNHKASQNFTLFFLLGLLPISLQFSVVIFQFFPPGSGSTALVTTHNMRKQCREQQCGAKTWAKIHPPNSQAFRNSTITALFEKRDIKETTVHIEQCKMYKIFKNKEIQETVVLVKLATWVNRFKQRKWKQKFEILKIEEFQNKKT